MLKCLMEPQAIPLPRFALLHWYPRDLIYNSITESHAFQGLANTSLQSSKRPLLRRRRWRARRLSSNTRDHSVYNLVYHPRDLAPMTLANKITVTDNPARAISLITTCSVRNSRHTQRRNVLATQFLLIYTLRYGSRLDRVTFSCISTRIVLRLRFIRVIYKRKSTYISGRS